MPRRTPKETLQIKRLPQKGDKLPLTVEVTRTGRNTWDTGDTVTIRIPGYDYPVTIRASALKGDEQ
jgi:hypothetical protein